MRERGRKIVVNRERERERERKRERKRKIDGWMDIEKGTVRDR